MQARGFLCRWIAGLASITACGGGYEFTGEVVELDPAVCSTDGEFSLESTNPYFPLEVGARWVLEDDDERVVISVLDETEVVAGVTTRVLEEREWEDGELSEVSRNFVAMAADGTVCYFGEEVDPPSGTWRADRAGSRPGIFMPAEPRPGLRFAMEIAPGEAEDEGLVVAVGETVEVPAGRFDDVIRILEIDPRDDEEEFKLFGRGVGFLTDEDLELVSR